MGRVLLGVCSRLARTIGVSEGIVRLVFIALFILDPRFVVVYLILALLMRNDIEFRPDIRGLLGYGLLALGLLFILKALNPIVAGAALIIIALFYIKRG